MSKVIENLVSTIVGRRKIKIIEEKDILIIIIEINQVAIIGIPMNRDLIIRKTKEKGRNL